MKYDNVTPLYTENQIANRIEELAKEISSDFNSRNVVLVCVLKGSFLFSADLARKLSIPVQIDFITASSYLGDKSTGEVKISAGSPIDYSGKDIIIVEDIIDTGLTMTKLIESFKARGVNDIKVATLLSKKAHRKHNIEIHYCGFDIDDKFVVGYGLDYNQLYRDLPFIGIYNGD